MSFEKSDLFSRIANFLASLSEAVSERVKTDIPFAFLFFEASACKDINISELTLFASIILSLKNKYLSLFLERKILTFLNLDRLFFITLAAFNVIFFSNVPL